MPRIERTSFWLWYTRALPARLLRLASIPLHRQMSIEQASRFESARMLDLAFGYIRAEGIVGDYHEFGVFDGHTFTDAWQVASFHRLRMQFHAYDSYAGLPEMSGVDASGPFRAGDYRADRAAFDRTLAARRMPSDRFTVTVGFFEQSLPSAPRHAAAVAFIDCDLYESTVPVLDFLGEVLVDGAVLMFDDWFCFHGRPDRGQQLACAQWLARTPDIRLVPYREFHWAGRAFIVNRSRRYRENGSPEAPEG